MDFDQLGEVSIGQVGTIPFYAVNYNFKEIKRWDDEVCKETNGDCFLFVKQYYKF